MKGMVLIMKKFLISEEGKFYKACLHTHTTYSDGKWTPEELKKAYMEKGYSIVAFTDHNIFIPHLELASDDFLPLSGFEADISENNLWGLQKPWQQTKTCHICFVAMRPDIVKHPLWHRTRYNVGNMPLYKDQQQFDENQPDYLRCYCPECINDMIKRGVEAGFFVTYNHPRWSMETAEQYMKYEGMHAMEIYNHTSYLGGFPEYNDAVYDEMLRGGKKLYCISTDDAHSASRAFGGYVMIKAKELEYCTIMDALVRGDFYASRGPEIKSLWFDDTDNTIHVECSDAAQVILSTAQRRHERILPEEGKDCINHAVLHVRETDGYVRVSVFDSKGLTADTNAYYVEDLLQNS